MPLQPVATAEPLLIEETEALDRGFARRETRHLTILLHARLVTPAGDTLARIRNVSAGGLMLETSMPLAVGEPVQVELRSERSVTGTVVWNTPPRAGIRLDAPLDVAQLLHPSEPRIRATRIARLQDATTRVARAPRLTTHCPVQLCHAGRSRQAMLLDLSQGGGHLDGLSGASVGDPLGVAIPGLPARKAVVRWIGGCENAGFVFLEPVPFAQIDPWLQNRALRFAAGDLPD